MRAANAAVVAACALALSCVPASEELPPTGAAGFRTEPTAPTRGDPFTTNDGWNVRIEKLALSVWVNTNPATGSYDGRKYGSGGWIFDAARPTVIYAPEISPGGAVVSAVLRGNYIYLGRENRERRRIVGVGEVDVERFNRAPDEGFDDYYGAAYGQTPSGNGPSIVLGARGERDGRVVRMDVALGVETSGGRSGTSRFIANVQEDAVVAGRLEIRGEELFRSGAGRLSFGEIAAADTNGDGVVTVPELLAAATTCSCPVTAPAHPGSSVPPPNLVDLIERNAANLLVPR